MTEEQIQAEVSKYGGTYADVSKPFGSDEELAQHLSRQQGGQPPTQEMKPLFQDSQPQGQSQVSNTPVEKQEPSDDTTVAVKEETPQPEAAENERRSKRQAELGRIQSESYSDLENQIGNRFRTQSVQDIATAEGVEIQDAVRLREDQMRDNREVVKRVIDTKKMLDNEAQRVLMDFPEMDRESSSYAPELFADFQDLYRGEYQSPVINRDVNEIEKANGPYRLAKVLTENYRRALGSGKAKWIAEGAKRERDILSKAGSNNLTPKSSQAQKAPIVDTKKVIADAAFGPLSSW